MSINFWVCCKKKPANRVSKVLIARRSALPMVSGTPSFTAVFWKNMKLASTRSNSDCLKRKICIESFNRFFTRQQYHFFHQHFFNYRFLTWIINYKQEKPWIRKVLNLTLHVKLFYQRNSNVFSLIEFFSKPIIWKKLKTFADHSLFICPKNSKILHIICYTKRGIK